MDMEEEKKNLLLDMIAFSTVDGELHKKEYDFLFLVANVLDIEKGGFNDLFHQEAPKNIIQSEFKRIQHFYRLALLMNCDGVLHEKEITTIYQISLSMGLNPNATKRVLQKMKKSPNTIIEPGELLQIFKEQQN
ncbi:excinuclease ABC subunit B [Flavobacterium sp. F-380]|uniref:Excinuclease ABC subunit B n=2 Tax=Flavobacterium kayseriense TaxID=2764714 RepID=A0ABR7JA45_9FLAO|nr:excinuclease ABC subunit B [Flavobacterium kayseriense]MBC5848910.1 excinuclease ABC subunit B [Flavobacterium kayseriense]